MLHCVIIAQLMLDFTIRKQKRNLDINDNTHVHHVKPETSDWVISNGAQREQIPLCHCVVILVDAIIKKKNWHLLVGSVVCVAMLDPMGSWNHGHC